jgi:hypothetical protein
MIDREYTGRELTILTCLIFHFAVSIMSKTEL